MRVEIVMLGTSAAIPTDERMGPSILVKDGWGNHILLDAGEGSQIRLSQIGVSPNSIDVIAITHEHGDHINGLPGLLQSMEIGGRKKPLLIIAPESLVEIFSSIEPSETYDFEVRFLKIDDKGETILREHSSGDRLIIKWFPVCHTIEAYGYRLEWIFRPRIDVEKVRALGLKPGPWIRELLEMDSVLVGGREISIDSLTRGSPNPISIVYTGDTAPCSTVIEAAKLTRVLIHESTFSSELREEAIQNGHSTARDAAEAARESGAEMLVMTHISNRYRGQEARRLLLEALQVFDRSVLARDLMRIAVSTEKHKYSGTLASEDREGQVT